MSKKTTEKAHNDGSEFVRESSSPSDVAKDLLDQFVDFADKTVDEVSRVGQDVLKNEKAPKIAAGAAIGAVAGAVLPFLSLPLGLIAGAGYVASRQAQKSEGNVPPVAMKTARSRIVVPRKMGRLSAAGGNARSARRASRHSSAFSCVKSQLSKQMPSANPLTATS